MAVSDYEMVFLLIGVVLIITKLAHLVMKRLDLPNVLGEVFVGFLLGPTVLGIYYLKSHPESILGTLLGISQASLDTSGVVISFIAEFAVLLLLFEVGTEIDFSLLNKVKHSAIFSALGGILTPVVFALSFLVIAASLVGGLVLPVGVDFMDVGLFLAIALTATSIGISTRIFIDLGKIKSKVAQTVVGAAIIDDIVSVTALALVVTYVSGNVELSLTGISLIIAKIILFFVISVLLFKIIVPWVIRRTRSLQDHSFPIFFSIAFMSLMAVLAQSLGLATIIGAFMAGMIIGNEEDFLDIERDIKPLADWIIPFFFITIGLQIDLIAVFNPTILVLGFSLAVVAILAKFLGGGIGARLSGTSTSEAKVIGLSMAAKGEVTLIFAVTAYSLGIFTLSLYTAVIFLVVIDSFVIPTLLKIAIHRWVDDSHTTGSTSSQAGIDDPSLASA